MAKRRLVVVMAVALVVSACTSANRTADTTARPSVQAPSPEASATPVPAPAEARVAASVANGFEGTVAIIDVAVFDGEELMAPSTVLIEGGMIVAVGASVPVPADAQIVDGTGKTLLPGFIDSHTHTFGDESLRRAVEFGVTTHLDMFTDTRFMAGDTAAEDSQPPRPQADMFSAGVLGTVQGGHGTQFGVSIPTLDTPDSASGWVQDRVDEGSSFIKLVLEDGSQTGLAFPTLDEATLKSAIDEAVSRDLLVVTHVTAAADATTAIANGSNGLAHLFVDKVADEAFVDLMVERSAFVVPTLVVLSSASSTPSGPSIIGDAIFGSRMNTSESSNLRRTFPRGFDLATVIESVTVLHTAGVPILAGSDAPNPGTTYGASLHYELEYFTQAGMTPAEALASATALPAAIFGLDDRGRVAPGMLADLVLVDGDPTVDITATRSIDAVWKDGLPIPID